MKARLPVALGLALAVATAAAQELNYLVLERHGEPYQLVQPGQPLAGGLFTELALLLVADSPLQLRPVLAPWTRLRTMVEDGRLRDWLAFGAERPGLRGGDCAPTPVGRWSSVLVTRRFNTLPARVDGEALRGRRLLVVRGQEPVGIDHRQLELRLLAVPSPESALQMLLRGRGDAYIEERWRLAHLLQRLGLDPQQLRVHDLSPLVPEQTLCLLLDRGLAQGIRLHLHERLAGLSSEGRITRLWLRELQRLPALVLEPD